MVLSNLLMLGFEKFNHIVQTFVNGGDHSVSYCPGHYSLKEMMLLDSLSYTYVITSKPKILEVSILSRHLSGSMKGMYCVFSKKICF